jgi:hypothetical protein
MRTRLIALTVAALSLAACSTPPPSSQPLAGGGTSNIVWVATLATNPCEAAVAPLQTRAIVGVNTATRQLRAGQIDAAQAQAVADAAREVQAAARAACADKRQPSPAELKRAQAALARIGQLTGSTQ